MTGGTACPTTEDWRFTSQLGQAFGLSADGHALHRRFHQTIRPAATTISGRPITLDEKIIDICRRDSISRRSSGSLGRIEIKSSSELSQFIMLRNRSRLPLKRRMLLAAQLELPTATKRPSLAPVFTVPAAASVSGPFLSFFGSMRISAELRFVVA